MSNLMGFKTCSIQTILFVIVLFGVFSCGNKTNNEAFAKESKEAEFDEATPEKDVQFLVNAMEINHREMQISSLAQSNSKNPEVLELSKMVLESHQMDLLDLRFLTTKKKISLPSPLTTNANISYKVLRTKSGTDFDKAYCNMMVKSNKEAIEEFRAEAAEGDDQLIKEWAQTMLSTLRPHLKQAITCHEKCAKM